MTFRSSKAWWPGLTCRRRGEEAGEDKMGAERSKRRGGEQVGSGKRSVPAGDNQGRRRTFEEHLYC